MSETYLNLCNDLLRELNEVTLTTLFPKNERKRIGTTTNQREGMSIKEFRFALNKMVKAKHKIIKAIEKLFIIIIHFLNLNGI